MKRYFLIIILVAFSFSGYAQSDSTATTTASDNNSTTSLWEQANAAYLDGQYPKAVADYEAILERGDYSAKLYYNLGNAYFQQNRIGKAILNYVRARNLDPADADIEYNLQLAQARTKDKIEAVPQFVLKKWLVSASSLMSSDGWALSAVGLFILTMACVLLWLLSDSMAVRKLGFFVAVAGMILFVASISYSQMASTKQYDEVGAVIINSATPVKSSPAEGGKDLFVLHEGTQLKVMQELGDWREVMVADGNKGWLKSSAIEMVN